MHLKKFTKYYFINKFDKITLKNKIEKQLLFLEIILLRKLMKI